MSRTGAERVLLLRHAQASFGSHDYDRLSGHGEDQAERLATWLAAQADWRFTHVVRGDMLRHAQTLAAIERACAEAGRSLPRPAIDPDWNEFDHASVIRAFLASQPDAAGVRAAGGSDPRAVHALLVAALDAWRRGALDAAVPESWSGFALRVARARMRLADIAGAVLVVTSGGAIARCAQAALNLDDERMLELNLSLRNTGVCEFRREHARWQLLSWNALPHLARAEDRNLVSYY